MTYWIADEFSATPGGRFRKHGPFSGEEFRDDILRDLLKRAIDFDCKLSIVLDGTSGYASAFLEEAFGGLVFTGMFDRDTVQRHVEIRALDPLYETYRISANRHIENAVPAL